MSDAKSESPKCPRSVRRALVVSYAAAAAIGCLAGFSGLLPFAFIPSSSTALSRVGFALAENDPQASPRAWEELRADVGSVRLALRPPEVDAYDLVVFVRGLESGGNAEWVKAEARCRELEWRRCEHSALEELRRRSRP